MGQSGQPVVEHWVPVDRRWLGFDRRSIGPAIGVGVLALLCAVVIPAIDRAVPGGTEIRAGDQVALGDRARLTPPTGWRLVDGILVSQRPRSGYPADATLTDGPVQVVLNERTWRASPRALLDRIRRTSTELQGADALEVVGSAQTVRTDSGVVGAAVRYRGDSADGLLAAFVQDGQAVVVRLSAPSRVALDASREAGAMIRTITITRSGVRA